MATAWHTELGAFLDRGGVVVVLDHNGGAGGTWQILDGMGLLSVTGATDATSATLTVSAPTDPLAAGLGATYSAPNGSLAFPGATGGTAVISRGADPVVLHLTR